MVAPSDELFARVYKELERLASKHESDDIADRTSLVHEAFLKMHGETTHRDTQHFYAIAATAMRQVLVDRARAKQAAKRGGGMQRVSLTGLGEGEEEELVDVIALDDAVAALAERDPRQASIVEMRFFGGQTTSQIAQELGVSESTVEKEWRSARDWLGSRLANVLREG